MTPSPSELVEYLWMLFFSMFGGLVHYLNEITNGRAFAAIEFAVSLLTSAFAGLLVFMLCKKFNTDEYTTTVCIAIAGHAGGQTIEIIKKRFRPPGA